MTTEVTLNDTSKKNGRIRSWLDGALALDVSNLEFRSVKDLKIDALYFSTFFGGDEPDWAATKKKLSASMTFECLIDDSAPMYGLKKIRRQFSSNLPESGYELGQRTISDLEGYIRHSCVSRLKKSHRLTDPVLGQRLFWR